MNETNRHGAFWLTVTAALPGAPPFFHTTAPVNVTGGETFGQLLKENIQFTPREAGLVTINAALSASEVVGQLRHAAAPYPINAALSASEAGNPMLQRTEQLLAVDTQPAPLTGAVAFAGTSNEIGDALKEQFGLTAVPLAQAQGKLKTIVVVSQVGQGSWQEFSDPSVRIENTPDPDLYKQQLFGPAGPVRTYRDLTPGKVTVDLFFADTYSSVPNQRVFDVAINGQTVLKDFDIVKEAGGKGRAIVKTFTVDAPTGVVTISVPSVKKDNATFAAVRVSDTAGNVTREVFRRGTYQDKAGEEWKPITFDGFDWARVLPSALARVHDDGTRLVLLTTGGEDAAAAAAVLADQKILTYSGMAGGPGPSWLGFWYFGRQHWLLDGLPADGVLDWPYQIGTGNGLFLSGPNVEAVIGYGKNHDPEIGIGAAVITHGTGQIVLLALPGLARAFTSGDASNFQPVTAKRLVYNALR